MENTNIIRLDTFIVFYDYKLEYIILINCKIKKRARHSVLVVISLGNSDEETDNMFVFGSTLFGPEGKKSKDDIETLEEVAKRDARIARLKSREERLLLELELTRNRMSDQFESREHLFDGNSELLDPNSQWPSSPGIGGSSSVFDAHGFNGSSTLPIQQSSSLQPLQAQNFFQQTVPNVDMPSRMSPVMINKRGQGRRAKSTTNLDRRRVKRSTVNNGNTYKNSKVNNNNNSSAFKFPKVRSNIDLMPMLTSTGDGVFEVGLNHADSSGHVLPVFRLPSVDETVTFINRIPTEPTEEEAKRIEEDRKDEEALASQLGLTEEELAEFEMEVEQITGHDNNGSRSRSQSLAEFGDSTANLPPLDFSQTIEGKESIIREEGSTLSLNKVKGRKRRREGDPDEHGTRRTPRCLRQKSGSVTSSELRKELTTSVHLIQDLTEKVREDIAEIHRTVPMVNVKAQLYMQRWGMEKFEKIFKRIEMQKERAALHLWQDKVKQLIKMEKRENYMKLRASRKLDHFVHRMQSNEMASAFHLWLSQMLEQKERERRKAEDDAARKIQNLIRTFLARRHVYELKLRIREAKESAAASKIQAMYRGRATRKHVAAMLRKMEENRAAMYIQRAYRGRLGRKMYNKMRAAHRENQAILRIQNAWRSRCARKIMWIAREENKKHRAATQIQRLARGYLARQRVALLREEKFIMRMAIKIQCRVRGILGRKKYRKQKEVIDAQRRKETKAAIMIQSRFRGHRSQLEYMLKLQSHRASMKFENFNATLIQKMWRGVLGRRIVNDMRGLNTDEMVRLARMHQEMWDEDNETYFYYNESTQAAEWTPPATGYVKVDGKLVLRNGDVIPDPADDPSANAKKCVECEDELAARYCNDCDDAYCANCYDNTHAAGKRAYHSWDPIGPQRCMECEKEVATRWCVNCDDPYCENCFKQIHSKGKRAKHEWNPIGDGPPEETAEDELDENNQTSGYEDFMAAEGETGKGEWEEYYDDDSSAVVSKMYFAKPIVNVYSLTRSFFHALRSTVLV